MDKQKFIEQQLQFLQIICELHENIKHLDESLQEQHPIAVVDNNVFFVFDTNEQEKNYKFILDIENPYPVSMPEGVLAAFPLEFYHNKSTAIISSSRIENPDDYVYIFHEFVHCFVWNKYGLNIRKELAIDKQQKKVNNMAWDLNYPFPYEDDVFINMTTELLRNSNEIEYDGLIYYHKKMKYYLKETDFEYMIWQEWTEGFARYVENLIREELGIEKNTYILSLPFDRVCFYEIGSKFIEILFNNDKTLNNDIEKLFYKMNLK